MNAYLENYGDFFFGKVCFERKFHPQWSIIGRSVGILSYQRNEHLVIFTKTDCLFRAAPHNSVWSTVFLPLTFFIAAKNVFFLPTPKWSQVAYILLRFNGNLPVKSTRGKSTTWSFRFRPSASPESAQGKAKGKAGEEDNDLDLDAGGKSQHRRICWKGDLELPWIAFQRSFFTFSIRRKKAGYCNFTLWHWKTSRPQFLGHRWWYLRLVVKLVVSPFHRRDYPGTIFSKRLNYQLTEVCNDVDAVYRKNITASRTNIKYYLKNSYNIPRISKCAVSFSTSCAPKKTAYPSMSILYLSKSQASLWRKLAKLAMLQTSVSVSGFNCTMAQQFWLLAVAAFGC